MIVGKHKEQDQKQPGERPSGSRRRLIRLVIMLPLLLILVSIIFLFTTNFIPSESMEPTLLGHEAGYNQGTQSTHEKAVKDHIFVNKFDQNINTVFTIFLVG